MADTYARRHADGNAGTDAPHSHTGDSYGMAHSDATGYTYRYSPDTGTHALAYAHASGYTDWCDGNGNGHSGNRHGHGACDANTNAESHS